jgi:hypothetical protein
MRVTIAGAEIEGASVATAQFVTEDGSERASAPTAPDTARQA